MVQMGMARDYSRYSGDYYDFEEKQAKRNERGIWGNSLHAIASKPIISYQPCQTLIPTDKENMSRLMVINLR